MAYPQITYDPGTGLVNLQFSLPPVKKPGADQRTAERSDSVSYSGKRQSLTMRVDTFKILSMDYVPLEDMEAWSSFMAFALTGKAFNYFPDADSTDSTSYVLEDKDWNPKFTFKGFASFSLKLRKAV